MKLYDAYIFDLDGTVFLGEALLPTAGETITRLRQMGKRTVFLSNNPTRTRTDFANWLTQLGLPTPPEDVVNSSYVMVDFLRRRHPQARLFAIGEASLEAELRRAGFTLTDNANEVDVVIASFDRTLVYRKLQIGFDALRNGARFYATNADKFCPVPGGGQPDAAAVIAALEATTDRQVEAVVGKPSRFMAEAILGLLGVKPEQCLMTGDRLETDVRMGLEAGMDAALTLTGATTQETAVPSPIKPTYIIRALAELLP